MEDFPSTELRGIPVFGGLEMRRKCKEREKEPTRWRKNQERDIPESKDSISGRGE